MRIILEFSGIRFEIKRLLRAVIILLSNFIMAAIVIVSIWALGQLFQILWRETDPRLFETVPLTYILHLADVAVLIAFLLNGVVETYLNYRRRPSGMERFGNRKS